MAAYIVLLDENGKSRAGWTLRAGYKRYRKIQECAQDLLKYEHAKYAYIIKNYTYEMCVMDENKFDEYVKKNGVLCAYK